MLGLTPSCLVIQGGTVHEIKSKREILWVQSVCFVWLRLCPEILQTGANAQRSWQGNTFTSGQNHKEITVEIHPKKKKGRNNLLCTVTGEAAHQHMIKGRNCWKVVWHGSHGSWWIHLQGRWIFTIHKTVRGSDLQTLLPLWECKGSDGRETQGQQSRSLFL